MHARAGTRVGGNRPVSHTDPVFSWFPAALGYVRMYVQLMLELLCLACLCIGEVQSLGRPVASQYGTGLFLQHPDQAGHVYNVSRLT